MKVNSFRTVYKNLCRFMREAPAVKTERWQGVDVSNNPAAVTYEMKHVYFEVDLAGVEDLDHWRQDIGPNLPWADDHFAERVCGSPLNPGKEWANWPWATSANKFREADGIFNHSYSERLWPKYPRHGNGGLYEGHGQLRTIPKVNSSPMFGIGRVPYGDLQDLVELLASEPYTRQAVIPLFFPQDTGRGDGGRKPCTLLYNFLVRNKKIDITYPMRSVDLRRHFLDDCYLAIRLLMWVLDRCREINPEFWHDVGPGSYDMLMTSLHVFANDQRELLEGKW
jgi:thymidylate synthase